MWYGILIAMVFIMVRGRFIGILGHYFTGFNQINTESIMEVCILDTHRNEILKHIR